MRRAQLTNDGPSQIAEKHALQRKGQQCHGDDYLWLLDQPMRNLLEWGHLPYNSPASPQSLV